MIFCAILFASSSDEMTFGMKTGKKIISFMDENPNVVVGGVGRVFSRPAFLKVEFSRSEIISFPRL